MFGLFKPKQKTPGMQLASLVEDIDVNVKKLKIGDAVFGDLSEYGFGTFAEYISINENSIVRKPDELSFLEASAIPHASALALQALRDHGEIEQEQKIFN